MSLERGWKAINLEMTDKIPHTQYISHDEFIMKLTGKDSTSPTCWPDLARALDFDFVWNQAEMPITKGRVSKMGHAIWSEINPQDNEVVCPFETPDDVLDFNPVAEYGIPSVEEMVKYFQQNQDDCKRMYPNTVFPCGRYHTLFSACIRTFGWDKFLFYACQDEKRFDKVLEGFFEISQAEVAAWLKTDMKLYLTHDDIVWTSGAVFSPDWYRKYIFPRYKRLWAPIKEAGIKVIYCSDGTYDQFVDDIADAGADGFIMEPTTSLENICQKYGQTHVIIGNADCRVLQFGKKEDIRREVERCVNAGRNCPGYFMAVGNHIPNGIPLEHVEYYFEVFEELRNR